MKNDPHPRRDSGFFHISTLILLQGLRWEKKGNSAYFRGENRSRSFTITMTNYPSEIMSKKILKSRIGFLGLLCLVLSSAPNLLAQHLPFGSSAPAELLQQAAALIQSGELPAAETNLRNALLVAPNDVNALSMLGSVLGMERRWGESNRYFEKALQLDPGNAPNRRNLAANQIQLGQYAAARRNLELLVKSNPEDRKAILMLGLCHERLRNYAQAIAHLEKAPELVRGKPDNLLALTRSYYQTGQKENARQQLTRLQNLTTSPSAIFSAGQIAFDANDLGIADRLLTSIQSTYPDKAAIYYQLAKIRYQLRRYGESQFLLEELANSNQANGSTMNLLAWCYLKQGNSETAAKIFSYAIEKFPAEPANFVDLGKLCLKENRLDAGLKAVQRGTSIHPGSRALFELKGEIESKEGLHAEAMQSYQKAHQLDSQSPEALLGLAIAQVNLLKNQEAVVSFEKGIKLYPRHARFYAEYGKTLLLPWASGEIPDASVKAEQLLKKALQLDGSISMANFELGNLLVKNGRAAESLPYLEKAARLDAKNAQTHFILARAYRALGRTEEAARETKLFEQLEPSATKAAAGTKNSSR